MKFLIKFLIIKLIDSFLPKRGIIKDKGYYLYKNKLHDQGLQKEAKKIYKLISENPKLRDYKSNVAGNALYFNDILKTNPKFAKIITPTLIKEIKSYFGENIKLDLVCLGIFFTNTSSNNLNGSGLFHHDSVGHRCKLFVPINPSGNSLSPTIYIKGSNKKSWGLKNFIKNYKNIRLENLGKDLELKNHKSIIAEFGDIYLFDTNGIHKGSYNKSNEMRCIIQFEFSRYKSLLRGDIGPAPFFMHKLAYDHFNHLEILRNNRIIKSKGEIVHQGLELRDYFHRLSDYLN